MRDNPSISRAEIALALGIHESSVKRRLESLISNGRIRRVGPDKGGHWEVIDCEEGRYWVRKINPLATDGPFYN